MIHSPCAFVLETESKTTGFRAQRLNTEYLKELDLDRLLYQVSEHRRSLTHTHTLSLSLSKLCVHSHRVGSELRFRHQPRLTLNLLLKKPCCQFRLVAGVNTGNATPYGGWIKNGSLVAGHFTGHYLSALAFTSAATADPDIVARSAYLVAQLAACQEAYVCAMLC